MNFLLDENVPLTIKNLIKEIGFNVTTLHDEKKLGIKNGEVADLALKKNAIIITLDSDFLKMKKALQEKIKVIYVKIHPRNPKFIHDLLNKHLNECINRLKTPGKVILTETGIISESL